jgi:SAM-dependent methyltransferase
VSTARSLAARGLSGVGRRLVGLGGRVAPPVGDGRTRTLAGDRELEWAWCIAQLPDAAGLVLDLGAGSGILSAAAAMRRHHVVAIDLEPCAFQFELGEIEYRRGDFNRMEFLHASFDFVLNCSTLEHVGLPGRYADSPDDPDGDLRAMERLAALLKPGGRMALTIPVGRDAVFAPLHRVYGRERLPRALAPFELLLERYWAKADGPRWREVERAVALAEQGSEAYYALGLFVLEPRARR